jgi:hypothetical protein
MWVKAWRPRGRRVRSRLAIRADGHRGRHGSRTNRRAVLFCSTLLLLNLPACSATRRAPFLIPRCFFCRLEQGHHFLISRCYCYLLLPLTVHDRMRPGDLTMTRIQRRSARWTTVTPLRLWALSDFLTHLPIHPALFSLWKKATVSIQGSFSVMNLGPGMETNRIHMELDNTFYHIFTRIRIWFQMFSNTTTNMSRILKHDRIFTRFWRQHLPNFYW